MTDSVILIDGGYYDAVNNYVMDDHGSPIDIEEFSHALCDYFDTNLLRTKFYHAPPLNSEGEEDMSIRQSFFDMIDGCRNHQFVQRGRVRPDTGNQKGVDVGIAVDLVDMAHKQRAEAFILFAGDEDLTHAVESAKDTLHNVYVAYGADPSEDLYVSQKLTQQADAGLNVVEDDWIRRCLYSN
ncbi:NYN domain-containing protein [Halorubrum miltondacostae]|uniref:NYN domain-containing protein n=1 Tax=Halorubrum miltondacostae TaxID=3076378 RepID=A0ABD5LYM1_9EURY